MGIFKGLINISDTLEKQRSEISPVEGKMQHFSPPQGSQPLHGPHGEPAGGGEGHDVQVWKETKEARNSQFCSSQEKFHTVLSRGVKNSSEAPYNPPVKFLM